VLWHALVLVPALKQGTRVVGVLVAVAVLQV
jgi:hypothetical protein